MFGIEGPLANDYLLEVGGLRELLAHVSDGASWVDGSRRITFWNAAAERMTGWAAEQVLGRRCTDGLLIHVDAQGNSTCATGCPLRSCLESAATQHAELYMQHRLGHRIPVRLRVVPVRDARNTLRGAVELFTDLSNQLVTMARIAELEEMAFIDGLTRVANRRFLEQHLSARLHELRRFGWPFGVVMFDIDRFKLINDLHGHTVGDQVLTMVAQTVMANARPFDLVARFGGEEFVHVVGHVSESAIREVAERIRLLVRSCVLRRRGASIGITISVGAAVARPDDTVESLFERADEALYASKRRGGDRVSTPGAPAAEDGAA